MKLTSLPSKIFLLGEYAALSGEAALVATLAPFFKWEDGDGTFSAPPGSPAARWTEFLLKRGRALPRGRMIDPHGGRGGFGASTAEFGLLLAASGETIDALEFWKKYRELMVNPGQITPSGADLVAQVGAPSTGVIFFEGKGQRLENLSNLWIKDEWRKLLFFAATDISGRKVITHEHLKQIWSSQEDFSMIRGLTTTVMGARAAIETKDYRALGIALTRYAQALGARGLECEQSREDRLAFCSLQGVLGAKGSGALLADAMVVLVQESDQIIEVLDLAQSRGLRFLGQGFDHE